MTGPAAELARLRALCPGAEIVDEAGGPLVLLPDLKVESAGAVHTVDVLLCPRDKDGYETRIYYSRQLPVVRNWAVHSLLTRPWHAFSWQGISAGQPWIDILAAHLEAAK